MRRTYKQRRRTIIAALLRRIGRIEWWSFIISRRDLSSPCDFPLPPRGIFASPKRSTDYSSLPFFCFFFLFSTAVITEKKLRGSTYPVTHARDLFVKHAYENNNISYRGNGVVLPSGGSTHNNNNYRLLFIIFFFFYVLRRDNAFWTWKKKRFRKFNNFHYYENSAN